MITSIMMFQYTMHILGVERLKARVSYNDCRYVSSCLKYIKIVKAY